MYYVSSDVPPAELVGRLHDAHCHPTTATGSPGAISVLRTVGLGSLVAMSTTVEDQAEVEALAQSDPARVIPAFGYHPWATHAIAIDPSVTKAEHYAGVFLGQRPSAVQLAILDELLDHLPAPKPIGPLLEELDSRLRRWPQSQLGEVGLDKNARVPFPPSFREHVATTESAGVEVTSTLDQEDADKVRRLRGKALSPFVTSLMHQTAVLDAQVAVLRRMVADEGRPRSISFHAVAVSGPVERVLERWAADWVTLPAIISILLHSCGLSWEAWQTIERKDLTVYVSISPLLLHPPRPPVTPRPTIAPLFARVAQDRILIESDQSDLAKNESALWEVVQALAAGRSWGGDDEAWAERDEAAKIAHVVDVVADNFSRWTGLRDR